LHKIVQGPARIHGSGWAKCPDSDKQISDKLLRKRIMSLQGSKTGGARRGTRRRSARQRSSGGGYFPQDKSLLNVSYSSLLICRISKLALGRPVRFSASARTATGLNSTAIGSRAGSSFRCATKYVSNSDLFSMDPCSLEHYYCQSDLKVRDVWLPQPQGPKMTSWNRINGQEMAK
jgi:hypothetical protein